MYCDDSSFIRYYSHICSRLLARFLRTCTPSHNNLALEWNLLYMLRDGILGSFSLCQVSGHSVLIRSWKVAVVFKSLSSSVDGKRLNIRTKTESLLYIIPSMQDLTDYAALRSTSEVQGLRCFVADRKITGSIPIMGTAF